MTSCQKRLSIMANKIKLMLKIIGWKKLVETADSLAMALARRVPPSSVSPAEPMLERQIEVLLNGLASRGRQYKENGNWSIPKKLAFQYLLQVNLKNLGYEVDFAANAAQRISRF